MTSETGEMPDLTPVIWIAALLVVGWIGWNIYQWNQRKKAEARVRRTLAQSPNAVGIEVVSTSAYAWTFRVQQNISMMGDDHLKRMLCYIVDVPQAGWTPELTSIQRRGHLVDLVKNPDSD